MSPEELAEKHPYLYHSTRASALDSIAKHGLLSTSRMLALFDMPMAERLVAEAARRPGDVRLAHPVHGEAWLTDNIPLSFKALAACLDDGLTPADWMRLLNRRVFFWASESDLNTHLSASMRRGASRTVMVFDTLSLVTACRARVELSAINTGSTIRKPARRGLTTFSPLERYSYREWQRLRGQRDRIKEVTVLDGIDDIGAHLVECYQSG